MGLDESAVDAVTQFRFKPAMESGKPVPVQINIRVNFQIDKSQNDDASSKPEAIAPAAKSSDLSPAPAPNAPPAAAPLTATSTDPYAAEPIVILNIEHLFSMAADGTGWMEHTFDARLQSDTAVKQYGVLTVPYASASQQVELQYVRARHPDGTVTETQISEAMDMPSPVTREAPFYSDQKELQLPIRNLRVGDTLELKYRIVRTRAEVPGQFWAQEIFSDAAVVLSQTIELRVPAGLAVNVWSPTVKPVESTSSPTAEAPAQHIYRWTHSQLQPTAGKAAEAAAAAKKKVLWTPEQEIDAAQGKLPTIAWSTFKSWQQVGAWYRSLEADRIVPDTLRAKAAELTAGKTTDEAKAHALYDYVATNIRYIGVGFGIGRFQPHTASEILANQYGDCKDKHTLFAALLAAENIHADAVLIGAGIRFNPDVPSPSAFNHLITHLTLNGKPVWLDTTAEVAPWGMLVSTTRDKQSLVIPSAPSAEATIVRTPLEPAIPDALSLEASGSLDTNGISSSHLVLTFRGDGEIAARSVSRRIQPAQYDKLAEILAKTMGFSGSVTNAEITRPTDTTQPFKLSFDYKREKAGDWARLRTLPEVIPVSLPRVTDFDPPVRAIQLGLPRTQDSTSSMKLPAGWNAIMPPSFHTECRYAIYDMTYRLEGNTIYATRHVAVLAKEVPVSQWKAYKSWIDAVNPANQAAIQLVPARNMPSGSTTSSTSPSSAAPGQTRALGDIHTPSPTEPRTKQIQDALDDPRPGPKNSVAYALAINNSHLADAQLLVDQALSLQEQQAADAISGGDTGKISQQMRALASFWDTAEFLYYRTHNFARAERYGRAAWELNPSQVMAIHLAFIYQAEHKPQEAIALFRMALSDSPTPAALDAIQSHLATLGSPDAEPLPIDIVTPLPDARLPTLAPDDEPLVDIVLSHALPPALTWLKASAAQKQALSLPIQSALASWLPDEGPELVLRHAEVSCTTGNTPACALHSIVPHPHPPTANGQTRSIAPKQ